MHRLLIPLLFGGVFLDGELVTSSRFLDFAFRFFAESGAAVPAAARNRRRRARERSP